MNEIREPEGVDFFIDGSATSPEDRALTIEWIEASKRRPEHQAELEEAKQSLAALGIRFPSEEEQLRPTPFVPRTVAARPLNPQAAKGIADARRARGKGDRDEAERLLSRWRDYLTVAEWNHERALLALQAGDMESAAQLLGEAAKLEPDNPVYLALHINILEEIDPEAALDQAERVLARPIAFPPTAVIQSASAIFHEAAEMPSLLRGLGDDLSKAIRGLDRAAGEQASIYAMMGHYIRGAICAEFKEFNRAAECFSQGLELNPRHPALLAARGVVLYGSSNPQAIRDLEAAIRFGDQEINIWPCVFLAHHALVNGEFQKCVQLCERGLKLQGTGKAKSDLAAWKAVAQRRLGLEIGAVKDSLMESLKFDPTNDWARRQLGALELGGEPANWPQPDAWRLEEYQAMALADIKGKPDLALLAA